MPYIDRYRRIRFEPVLEIAKAAMSDSDFTLGDLNYILTGIIHLYWERGRNYARVCNIVGTLESVKQEFYRRVAAPYEEEKCKLNGDVYIKKEYL